MNGYTSYFYLTRSFDADDIDFELDLYALHIIYPTPVSIAYTYRQLINILKQVRYDNIICIHTNHHYSPISGLNCLDMIMINTHQFNINTQLNGGGSK